MADNKRIYYAIQQIGVAPIGSTVFEEIHGAQSVAVTTTFDTERIFELGQIDPYENVEAIPRVEITTEKVLDGYPPVYLLCTSGSPNASLAGRSASECIFALSAFNDTQQSASGSPISEMTCSGASVNSLSYTFPVEGNFAENVTLIANQKRWTTGIYLFSGAFPGNDDSPFSLPNSGGVNRREDLVYTPASGAVTGVNGQLTVSAKCTVLPRQISGITSSGTNPPTGEFWRVPVQNITVSTDMNRQELLQLGSKLPYFRFVNFPIDVTCDIEITDIAGDYVDATEEGIYENGENTRNETIIIRAREGTMINLGDKNRLTSVSRTGGDASGGNVTTTFSYINSNFMTVTHPQDPTVALRVS